MKKTIKLKICSLFTGCGGMDLGAVGGFEFQGRKFNRLPTEIVFVDYKTNLTINMTEYIFKGAYS